MTPSGWPNTGPGQQDDGLEAGLGQGRRHPPGVEVTRTSALEAAGATRLGRLFHLPLGRCEGRLQVGSDLGHDLLGAADPRLPAACTASATLAPSGRPASLTVTLCPATCSFTEMVTVHLRSAGDGRTYPHAEPVTKFPAQVLACARSRSPWSGQDSCQSRSGRWCALGYSRCSRKYAPGGC
jgi:hypothetical protein